jgi:signal transduction histidine kinase
MTQSKWKRTGIWCLFGSLWTLVFAVASLMSSSLLKLERAERAARHAAAVEENLRLALWRLDTTLGPLLAQQSLQSVAEQTPAEQDDSKLLPQLATSSSESLREIPLLTPFQMGDQEDPFSKSPITTQTQKILTRLNEFSRFRSLALPELNVNDDTESALANAPTSQRNRSRAQTELSQRAQNVERANTYAMNNSIQFQNTDAGVSSIDPVISLTAFWDDEEKLLLGRQPYSGAATVEGWQVDWPLLKREMKQHILDLLPNADFQAVTNLQTQSSPDMLVSIPCLLLPGNIAGDFQDTVSDKILPLQFVLMALWLGVLTAAVATGFLLGGALRLSDRRAAFVAAVTHELRTPLTTLQLYSEMLSSDMIQNEDTKKSYLQTLQNEVQRIVHLVENVFAYARLEKGRRPRNLERLSLTDLMARSSIHLQRLAERAAMELVIEPSNLWDTEVMGDPSMLEQILVNLVDNAGKYAKETQDRRIFLMVSEATHNVQVSVEDRGNGFEKLKRQQAPFSKSVQQAAESAPGIGLGLTICQRFAKELGGKLILENTDRGARVTLSLPKLS